MYRNIIKPILFRFNAERVHDFALANLRFFGGTAFGRWILSRSYRCDSPKLEREVFGITFPNPVGVAAGFDTDGRYCRELRAMGFGFIEVGTVTVRPQPGNMKPRIFNLPKDRAIVARTGQPNAGLDEVLENLRQLNNQNRDFVVGVNIASNTLSQLEEVPAEYLKLFRSLYQYVDYFVVNVTALSSYSESIQNKEAINEILEGLFDFRRGQSEYCPILLKLSPDWSNELIDDAVGILIDTPLDGLVVAGATADRGKLTTDQKALDKIGGGCISGAPLLDRTLELIKYVGEKMDWQYPIIASGGATRPKDVQQMLDAGASLVEVYSGITQEGPKFAKRTCKTLLKTQ